MNELEIRNTVCKYLPMLGDYLLRSDYSVRQKLDLVTLKPGEPLYELMDRDDGALYVVMYGTCRICGDIGFVGKHLFFGRGSVVGMFEAVADHQVERTASVLALTKSILLKIPRDTLQNEIYDENKELVFWLIRNTIEKYHVKMPARGDAVIKLTDFLLDIYQMCYKSTDGEIDWVTMETPQDIIAELLQISVRSVSRAIHIMKKEELLVLERGHITITRKNARNLEEKLIKSRTI